MSDTPFPLPTIQVASPCDAPWEAMPGDDRTRLCPQCSRRVYNLAALSRREAEELFRQTEGRLCVRLYRRADGTVLTSDCPVGLWRLRRTAALVAGTAAALLLAAAGWANSPGLPTRGSLAEVARGHLPPRFQAFLDWIDPPPLLGAICPPSRRPARPGNPEGVDPQNVPQPPEAREPGLED
jgi:hypothetical protein